MRVFFVILILFGFAFLVSCNKEIKITKIDAVQDSTIYNFINDMVVSDSSTFRFNILGERVPTKTFNLWDIRINFSKDDTTFIAMQLEKKDTIFLKQEFLKVKMTVTQRNEIQKHFNPLMKNSDLEYGYCYIYKPVFSADLSTCIVTYGFYCGIKCAEELTTIFKRENGVWKKLKVVAQRFE